MKIHIVGTRPNFIKLKGYLNPDEKNYIIHTGQHYDKEMSMDFFDTLSIPKPDINLYIQEKGIIKQVSKMLSRLKIAIDAVYVDGDEIIVYGDCSTALAGALVAKFSHYPLTHVESGIRHNICLQEDIIRKMVENLSDILICPYDYCKINLVNEKVDGIIIIKESPMITTLKSFVPLIQNSTIINDLNINGDYYVLTIHRSEHTNVEWMESLFKSLKSCKIPIIFPCHPRTRGIIKHITMPDTLQLLKPMNYIDFMKLIKDSKAIITDSGGIQLESHYFGVPCYTLNNGTYWKHTLESNTIVGDNFNILEELVK